MAKYIELTKGHKSLVDDDDYEILNSFNWQAQPTRLKDGYYAIRNNGCDKKGTRLKVRMHRSIMNCPTGFEVDHINGNTLDNRKSNLRIVTHDVNIKNQKSRLVGKSKYRGVTQHAHLGWRARITINYKRICLGVFPTEEMAAEAAIAARKELYGNVVYER